MNGNRLSFRIGRALLLSPLSMILVAWFYGFGAELYDLIRLPQHHISSGTYQIGFIITGYMIIVAAVITLVYGIPVYLLLHRFNRATLLNLNLAALLPFLFLGIFRIETFAAGVFLGLLGSLVATTFWLIVTPYHGAATHWIKRGVIVLIALMLGLLVSVLVIDAAII